MGDELQCRGIPRRSLAHYPLDCDVVQEVDVAERLALGRIRQMNLDERPADPKQRVAKGDAGVGEPAGVDYRPVEIALVKAVDQRTLVVRLEGLDREPELRAPARQPVVDLGQRRGP